MEEGEWVEVGVEWEVVGVGVEGEEGEVEEEWAEEEEEGWTKWPVTWCLRTASTSNRFPSSRP